jgi:hypothetical protein
MINKALKLTTLWLWGGFIYYLIEIAWRGYSHPSMFILGGICFVTIGGINNYFPWRLGLAWQALIGAGIITALELITGLIVNRWLGLGVWDYSGLPLNVLGQISLLYSFFWIPLAAVAVLLDDILRWKLYGEQKPIYTLF